MVKEEREREKWMDNKMELKEFLHMKHGDGDLSYSQNQATFTKGTLACITKPMLEGAIKSLLQTQHLRSHTILTIADLGCATGSASIDLISTVIELVKDDMRLHDGSDHVSTTEIHVYLNDLPSNDFNSLFRDMWRLQHGSEGDVGDRLKLLFAGVPGSFYDRLFPSRSLHLAHSSYSAHWLSQAPPELYIGEGSPVNKGEVYISETSPLSVAEAYWSQFQRDFIAFLSCRSEEVLPEGRVLFTLRGRPSEVDGKTWQPWELILFTKAVTRLIYKGLMKQEKVDSFDMPFYAPSPEDIKDAVHKQGSFAVERVETLKHGVAPEYENDPRARAEKLSRIIRSYTESLVAHHFGLDIPEPLYKELASVTLEFLADDSPQHFTIAVLLIRTTL